MSVGWHPRIHATALFDTCTVVSSRPTRRQVLSEGPYLSFRRGRSLDRLSKILILPPRRLAGVDLLQTIFKKRKVFPYSLPSVGPGADPGVQAVSPQVT